MDLSTFIITYWKYILSALVSGCFLVVNIIQFFRTKDKQKLKDAICRIPEFIRSAEEMFDKTFVYCDKEIKLTTTTATAKSAIKKSTVEALLIHQYGEKFVKKYISVFDDAIEDILNTPQKKGGSIDGISKENEER